MGRYLMTHSLLSSWLYTMKGNPYEDIFIVLGEEVNQLAGRHRSADLVDAVTFAESRTNQLFHCRCSFLKI